MTTIDWNSAVSGDWSDASNWTPSTVPDHTDDVEISPLGSPTISLSLPTAIRSLTVDDGSYATLDVTDARLIVRKGAVNGDGDVIDLEHRGSVSIGTNLVNNNLIQIDVMTGSHGSRLAIGGNLYNNGTFLVGTVNFRNGTSTVTVAGTLINYGDVGLGGLDMNGSVSMTVGGYAGPGTLSLTGAQGHQTSFIDTGAAPTVLRGSISLQGDALMQFGSGGITSIGGTGVLALLGPDARITIAGESGNTSALDGLTLNNGEFVLGDGASYATASGVDFHNNNIIDIGAIFDPTSVSTLSIGGNLYNNGFTFLGAFGPSGTAGNGTLTVAGTIVNNDEFLLFDSSDTAPASATAAAAINNDEIEIYGGSFTVTGDLKNFSEIGVGQSFPITSGSSNLTVDGTFYNNGGELDIGASTAPGTATLGALVNNGLITVEGGYGATPSLTVTGTSNNWGTIFVAEGSATLTGDMTGRGTAEIGGGGVIEFGGAVSNNVSFDDVTGTLKLDTAQSFTGTVSGMTQGDSIDLANFEFANGAAITDVVGTGNAGTFTRVTVADGALSLSLRLLNNYAGEFAADAGAYTLTADNAPTHQGTSFQLAAAVI